MYLAKIQRKCASRPLDSGLLGRLRPGLRDAEQVCELPELSNGAAISGWMEESCLPAIISPLKSLGTVVSDTGLTEQSPSVYGKRATQKS